MAPRVAIDTCVFIDVLTRGQAPGSAQRLADSIRLFRAAESGLVRATLCAIVPAEVAGASPMREVDGDRAETRRRRKAALDWIQGFAFDLVEVDRGLAEAAAELTAPYALKGPDALVLAAAIASGCETLYTWDERLLRIQGESGLRILTPEDYEPESGRPLAGVDTLTD